MTQTRLRQEHRQQQTLTPRLQQAVRLLQLSSLDFAQEVSRAMESNPFLEGDEADSESAAATPAMRLARAALTHMKPGAAIIATSSETGIKGTRRLPDYSATKGAVNAFTKSLAIDLLERGIRVNAVAPGPVWTPLNPSDSGLTAEKAGNFGADSPMKRAAQPEELAPAYVFLASNADSSYITGTVLQVMGGETTGG